MVGVATTDSGLKKIEAALLGAALLLVGLGASTVEAAMESKDTTMYLMSTGLILLGLVCGALYIYVDKKVGAPDNGDIEAVVNEDPKNKPGG
jgi:hypothetical protein